MPALVAELLADPARLARDEGGDARDGTRGCGRPDRRRADRACQPLTSSLVPHRHKAFAGRRLYFVGIGGAGSPPTPTSPAGWAPRCAGWDLAGHDLPRGAGRHRGRSRRRAEPARRLRGRRLDGAPRRSEGRPRAEFLAELVALRRSIVVGGAHGKTTTAAMIAFVLRELGYDPAWIIGGVVPQLGGNAGRGDGLARRRGRRVRPLDRAPPPEIAVVTNVELDHHATYASEAELEAFFDEWLAGVPQVVRGWELDARRARARRAGRAQPPERRDGARRARARGRAARRGRARAIVDFAAWGGGSSSSASAAASASIDDYGHNPTEIAATLRTRASRDGGAADRRVPAARLRAHAAARAASSATALGLADAAVVTDVIGGRDAPRPGCHREARPRLACASGSARRGGRRRWTTPRALALAWARPGDVVVTLGVGEPWRIARAIVDGLPRDRPPVSDRERRRRSRASRRSEPAALRGALPRRERSPSSSTCSGAAERRGARVGASGSDRTCSRPTTASTRSCCGSAESSPRVETDERPARRRRRGDERRLPPPGAAPALGGFEFACAIPGTAGGGVRMNAGAYGGDWSAILVARSSRRPTGTGWLTSAELGLAYRHSSLRHGQVVAARRVPRSTPRVRDEIREHRARISSTGGRPRSRRTSGRSAASSRTPGRRSARGRLLELCGLKGHRIGGAVISPKHANFIENAGGATTADCVALMVEARRRARDQFGVELEREVVFVGALDSCSPLT